MSFKYTEIGKIPVEWDVKMIQEIGEVVSGGTPKTKEDSYWDGNISWITPKDLSSFTERYIEVGERSITELGLKNSSAKLLPKGTVLFSSRAPIGYLAIARKELCTNQGFKNIVCDKKYSSNEFLFYMLKAKKNEIESIAGGSTFKEVSGKVVKEFKIPIPPLNEQKAIAHILSTLDDKIEVNNQINKTLENMAQAIFKQWFVDFEFPNEDGEPYKSSGGEMIESELGMIPKGWGVEEIGNISDIQNGFAFKAPEYVDEGVKVLRTLNIGNDGYFNNTDIVFLPQSYKSEKYEKYYFEEFDVALVMVGASIGKIGMILKNTAGGLQNQNMWRFRRKEKRVSQIFIYYTVKQAQNISKNWSTGSARDFYRKDSFRKIKVILPEKRIMDLFEKITKPIFQNISNHVCENDELISMRDGLLPKLMSGEIRVPLYEEGDAS